MNHELPEQGEPRGGVDGKPLDMLKGELRAAFVGERIRGVRSLLAGSGSEPSCLVPRATGHSGGGGWADSVT